MPRPLDEVLTAETSLSNRSPESWVLAFAGTTVVIQVFPVGRVSLHSPEVNLRGSCHGESVVSVNRRGAANFLLRAFHAIGRGFPEISDDSKVWRDLGRRSLAAVERPASDQHRDVWRDATKLANRKSDLCVLDVVQIAQNDHGAVSHPTGGRTADHLAETLRTGVQAMSVEKACEQHGRRFVQRRIATYAKYRLVGAPGRRQRLPVEYRAFLC